MAWNTHFTDFPFLLLNCDQIVGEIPSQLREWKRVNVPFFTAEYITSGSGTVIQNNVRVELKQDTVFLLHKGGNHHFWPNPETSWEKLFFIVDGELMEQLLTAYHLNDFFYLCNAQALRPCFEAMKALKMCGPRLNERAALIFHEFLSLLSQIHREPQQQIPPPVAMLKQQLDASERTRFELNEYAQGIGFTASYLIRGFHKIYGCSPMEYLLMRRIESAKRMLRYSNYSIKEIAAELCFSDQYYFSNYFKRHTQSSPSAFRRIALGVNPGATCPEEEDQ